MGSPFRPYRRGASLVLELDTPGSPVNILTPEAIAQILDVLPRVDPRDTRAVVFTSNKPRSFLNGARLLLAASLRTPEDAREAARAVRTAYDAVARCPVPTVAAISGACYGCGLELALACDYRLVSDGYDAELYLTELADYLLTPVFGSTQRLPGLVGLETAIDLVLWGRRLHGAEALIAGIADRAIDRGSFDQGAGAFLAELEARGDRGKRPYLIPPSESRQEAAAIARRTRARIADLAPEVRPVHHKALELLLQPFARGYTEQRGLDAELLRFGETVTSGASTRAVSFFFIRQMAAAIGAGAGARPAAGESAARIEVSRAPELETFRGLLEERPLTGGEGPSLSFRAPGEPASKGVAVTMGRAPALLHRPAAPWVHFPLFKERKSACEVITCGDDPPPGGLITFLCRLGFTPVVTRRLGRPVSERLIDAFVRGGGNLRSVQVELQHFGFDALPRVLLAARRRPSTHEDAATAVVAELLAEGLRALSEGAVRHPAQIDLLARLLFGFPLHRGSLFRMLDEPDAGALSDVVAARLGDHDAAEMLAERIGSGRGFHGALKRAA